MTMQRPIAPATPVRSWTVRQSPAAIRAVAAARARTVAVPQLRFEVSWLGPEGRVHDFTCMGPAIPLFVESFTAIARGALLLSEEGPIAIEDARPGLRIATARGPKILRWIGSHTSVPGGDDVALYRLPAGTMGMGRPSPDLVLGGAARIVTARADMGGIQSPSGTLIPIFDVADGQSVIRITPPSAVTCYHLGFDSHEILSVNGLEIESVHPGLPDTELPLEIRQTYLELFPHIGSFDGFGPLALPRSARSTAAYRAH